MRAEGDRARQRGQPWWRGRSVFDNGEEARRASQLARVALIVSAMAFALAILGLFLPIG
jgi:hypothetical protein